MNTRLETGRCAVMHLVQLAAPLLIYLFIGPLRLLSIDEADSFRTLSDQSQP